MALVLDYAMQEDDENPVVNDDSASSNDGSLLNGATQDSSNPGPGGSYLKSFRLNSDYVIIGSGYAIGTAQTYTVQFFAKRFNKIGIQEVWGGVGNCYFEEGTDTIIISDDSSFEFDVNTGVDTTNWHHYAIRLKSNATTDLYVDGVLINDFSDSRSDGVSIDTIGIGPTANFFNGYICGFRIYNEIRSQAQIQTDYLLGVTEAGDVLLNNTNSIGVSISI